MQDRHGITWYVRETGNALKAVNDLIREAGFLMKYHSAFSKAYADRAVEEKIFNKKKKRNAKGKTVAQNLMSKSLDIGLPKKKEEEVYEEVVFK